ncbi:hypothetical protein NHX12_024848 [Muraenolepis orangiensis]|uniref:Protein phosphatase 1 regulatory subunit 1B n=1 Tax=Muraenolepis orangiensis TaxID=630683 RepID=A0A9Q0IP50_9TELE|nr:hypothetical protein NHX12_024848 [Muraenolepis orangiensis]
MDSVLPTEAVVEVAGKESGRRRIQFSVPPPSNAPVQLDPRQVEMTRDPRIRRRRPTPATLFTLSDPEEGAVSHKGAGKASQLTPPGYEPPSLQDVQRMAEAHQECWASVEKEDSSSSEDEREGKGFWISQTYTHTYGIHGQTRDLSNHIGLP